MKNHKIISYTEKIFNNRSEAIQYAKLNHGYFSAGYNGIYIVTIYH